MESPHNSQKRVCVCVCVPRKKDQILIVPLIICYYVLKAKRKYMCVFVFICSIRLISLLNQLNIK